MSVTLIKTKDTEAFSVIIDVGVQLKEDKDQTQMNVGEFLAKACFMDLVKSDITLEAGKIYRVRGTISIQDVTEDETPKTDG